MFDEASSITVTGEDSLDDVVALRTVLVIKTVFDTSIFEDTTEGIFYLIFKTGLCTGFQPRTFAN